jgi:LDH2 family malate/lactate/ureidoglycolate dehydrogenase
MIIKSLFAHACLTGASGPQEIVASNITEQPLAKTVASTVIDLKDVMKSKEAALQKYVEQLRKAAELPDEQTILSMEDKEITCRNQRLEQLFTNFEEQIKRDYLILQKI